MPSNIPIIRKLWQYFRPFIVQKAVNKDSPTIINGKSQQHHLAMVLLFLLFFWCPTIIFNILVCWINLLVFSSLVLSMLLRLNKHKPITTFPVLHQGKFLPSRSSSLTSNLMGLITSDVLTFTGLPEKPDFSSVSALSPYGHVLWQSFAFSGNLI